MGGLSRRLYADPTVGPHPQRRFHVENASFKDIKAFMLCEYQYAISDRGVFVTPICVYMNNDS